MNRNELIIIEGRSIRQMAYQLCALADLAGDIRSRCPDKNALIALKPNLLGPIRAEEGATTHPQILEGVLSYLQEKGFRNLAVMESSWVGDRTQDALLVCGIGQLCADMGVPFLDLQKDGSVRVNGAGMELNVCKKALEAEYLINLPVLKGHCQTRMTCALKNMKGCIPASEKRRFHRMGLHEPIGHLSAAIHQDFILADAICPDLTFEDGGNPVELNRLICAADPVLLDAYGAQAIGLDPRSVRYIDIARECGVGCADTGKAEISLYLEQRGEQECRYVRARALPELPWDRGAAAFPVGLREAVDEVNSCSACYGTLLPVLQKLREEGLLERLPGKISIGQGFRGRTGELGIGDCTHHFRNTIGGCPPDAEEMERFLRALAEQS